MIQRPKRITGTGEEMDSTEWMVYRSNVYECLFYHNKKWTFEGQSMYFSGSLIHYSDFMKAKRGVL